MTLLNDLYDITASAIGTGHARFTLRLRADSRIFRAHFPGMPITPGVCIVQMAKELLETVTGSHLVITSVKNAKFLTVMTPDIPDIDVHITKIKIEGDSISANAEFSRGAQAVYAKISLQTKIA